MEHVELCIKIKLRNSASCGLLLYEYITMDGPRKVKSLESVHKSIHRKYYMMLIMQEGNAAVSAVESIAVIQRSSVFRTILQVPPLVTDRRVQIGIYMYVCICIEERQAQFCVQVVSVSEVFHFHKPMRLSRQ